MAEKIFDENDAVAWIKREEPQARQYSDDDILLVMDIMLEYDEKMGEEDDYDLDSLVAYVKGQLKKDRDNVVAAEDVEGIVKAELGYEEWLIAD